MELADLRDKIKSAESEVYFTIPKRPKFEFLKGYKIASSRGARLYETSVLNIGCQYKTRKVDATSRAVTYMVDELIDVILLLPDNSKKSLEQEKNNLKNRAEGLLRESNINMSQLHRLFKNLDYMDIYERCAQSLMHEYGHVLLRRFHIKDNLYGKPYYAFVTWFEDNGYYENVEDRFADFHNLTIIDQLYYLKESFAEDYRISLNMASDYGDYILPNRVCYIADIQNPKPFLKGVEIVEKIIEDNNERHLCGDSEIDTIKMLDFLFERLKKYPNWKPGTKSLKDEEVEEFNINNK